MTALDVATADAAGGAIGGGRRAVLGYKALVARRYWRGAVIGGVVNPLLYVLALGVGLGAVVDRGGDALGVPYLQFVAPAFLTATALQIAAGDAAYPIVAGFKWQRFYHAMAATPLRPSDIGEAELTWIAVRISANSAIYLAVVAAFGGVRTGWAVLIVPVAVLTGVAFAAPVMAAAATVEAEGNLFNVLSRFVVIPMTLFSGTFYPIARLPEWGQVLARITPLWHGVQLARAAALGGASPLAVLVHVGYLVLWLVVGLVLVRWRFQLRLNR